MCILVQLMNDSDSSLLICKSCYEKRGIIYPQLIDTEIDQSWERSLYLYISSQSGFLSMPYIPNHCTTWTLGNFSRAWIVFGKYKIPFCHIRHRSITCHFLENNLHLSRIRTALSSTTEKLHMELYATDSEFSTHSPAFLLFLRIKLAFSNLGINPIVC